MHKSPRMAGIFCTLIRFTFYGNCVIGSKCSTVGGGRTSVLFYALLLITLPGISVGVGSYWSRLFELVIFSWIEKGYR